MTSALRLDYVSPLPPVRSGIADYSRDLVPALADLCDLRIIAVPGQEVSAEIRRRFPMAEATELGADDRLPLYQMGNNPYHEQVQRLAIQRPGVLTLHDVVLHHLLVEATLAKKDFEGYAQRLGDDHGWIGELVAKARYWGELSSAAMFGLPAHRTLVRLQRGVLVHSQWAAERVLEENPDLIVHVVPMGIPLPEPVRPETARAFRSSRNLPLDCPLLGTFGFQTPIKRTAVIIQALAEPCLRQAHLLIAGEVSPQLALEEEASSCGVADRVHITGFLSYDEFEAAITACDLCVNLRYPTAGETSASLLRVMAHGKPVVVSDYAQFRELPADVAIPVPLGTGESRELARSAGEALAKPETLARMGQAARAFVAENHDPQRAAAAVVGTCLELREMEPPKPEAARIAPPTTLLWRDLPGEIEVTGAGRPWPVGERRELVVRLTNRSVARWLATREKPGGVQLTVEWRAEIGGEALEEQQNEMPRSLDAGQTYEFRLSLRRPLGTSILVIEPHIDKLSGLSAFGGPSWVGEFMEPRGAVSAPST